MLDGLPLPRVCTGMQEEIRDVIAYQAVAPQAFTGGDALLLASAALVASHNLVTDSIKYPVGRRAFVCIEEVLEGLPHEFPGVADNGLIKWHNRSVPGIPGLGPHRLVKCPSE